ncbi:hypothetical protein BRCH_03232c [Candidatus Burkholderia brachyanthoides]|nr:hypothetical protein BRCH_03232c [Candidatus Burkholderia brachyanthoides]
MCAIPPTELSDSDASLPRLVCLPGAMCSPLVFESYASASASGMHAVALNWLETKGPHDLESIARRARARSSRCRVSFSSAIRSARRSRCWPLCVAGLRISANVISDSART